MPITWTRLHERLGLKPGRLTYEDVRTAVEHQVEEEAGLDWKARIRSDEAAKGELAKDLAAMANSGGGLLVIGVDEGGREAAGARILQLSPIPRDESASQQVRSVAYGRIRPPVEGIEVDFLSTDDDPDVGVLAVWVPASSDAPHFYEKNGQPPYAPWRNGPHTEHLRENEIARAYRERFRRQDDAQRSLAELVQSAQRRLSFDKPRCQHWAVIASQPLGSRPLGVEIPDRDQLRKMVLAEADRRLAGLIEPNRREAFGSDVSGQIGLNPRPGLRRWVFAERDHDQDGDMATWGYAELRHDGALVLALAASLDTQSRSPHAPSVLADFIERAAGHGVALTRAWTGALSIGGPVAMISTVLAPEAVPVRLSIASRRGLSSHPEIPPWSNRVDSVEAVDVTLPAIGEQAHDLVTAHELADGVINQFGVSNRAGMLLARPRQ